MSPIRDTSPQHDADGRKRVSRACDRCRLKKIKCDGKVPCTRCQVENSVCRFGERKKSIERRIPPGYVEYLEEQQRILVKALKMAWQQYAAPPLASSPSDPSVHSIMEDLGVMQEFAGVGAHANRHGGGFAFEEDLEKLRRQCEAEANVETAEGETAAKRSSSQHSSASASPATTPAHFGDDSKPAARPTKSQRLASAGITPLKALPTFAQAYGPMMDWPGSKPYSIGASQQHTLADGWTRSPVSISYTVSAQKDGLEWNASLQMTALDMAIPPDVTALDMTIAPDVTMDAVNGMELDNDWATIAPSMLDFTIPMQD